MCGHREPILTEHIQPHVHGDRFADIVVRGALIHTGLLTFDALERQYGPFADLGSRFARSSLGWEEEEEQRHKQSAVLELVPEVCACDNNKKIDRKNSNGTTQLHLPAWSSRWMGPDYRTLYIRALRRLLCVPSPDRSVEWPAHSVAL